MNCKFPYSGLHLLACVIVILFSSTEDVLYLCPPADLLIDD